MITGSFERVVVAFDCCASTAAVALAADVERSSRRDKSPDVVLKPNETIEKKQSDVRSLSQSHIPILALTKSVTQ